MTGRQPAAMWRTLLAGEVGEGVLADVGTSTVTGIRALGAPRLATSVQHVGHPVLRTLALRAGDCLALGSDFVRAGLIFSPPALEDDTFVDGLGVRWLWAEGAPAPLEHPLEHADLWAVARHPRPVWPEMLQLPEPLPEAAPRPLVVADAPCSGLVEMCFALRNNWQFLSDLTDNWRIANALLDWALETIVAGYEHLLSSLPEVPDLVQYGDDYGYQGGMFLSDVDFRTFVRPRLRTLLSRIRAMTPAPICFHSCGAIRSILPDLADLGVEALNLEHDAKNMTLADVRAALPAGMILHGYTDLRALGQALGDGDRRSVALLLTELVESLPAVAAPVDSLASEEELFAAAKAALLVHQLDPSDLEQLRCYGPVRAVLENAIARAERIGPPALAATAPDLVPRSRTRAWPRPARADLLQAGQP